MGNSIPKILGQKGKQMAVSSFITMARWVHDGYDALSWALQSGLLVASQPSKPFKLIRIGFFATIMVQAHHFGATPRPAHIKSMNLTASSIVATGRR